MTTSAGSSGTTDRAFQPDPEVIHWRMYFRSSRDAVFRTLATAEGRSGFWAESAAEKNSVIHFVVPGNLECRGRILKHEAPHCFVTEYFGWTVQFDLRPDPAGAGTDLEMTCRGVPAEHRVEVIAGWVSVLLAMKAAVDHGVDLRNHDPARTWWQCYADN